MRELLTRDTSTIEEYAATLADKRRLTPVVAAAVEQALDVRAKHDVVYYIAGALTGMSDEVKERYTNILGIIMDPLYQLPRCFGYAPHINGTDPVKHPDVTPREVRDIDYLWAAKTADRHVNFWTPMAHGNAIEAGWAEEHGIPSIYMVEAGVKLSRLVLGMQNIRETIVYQTDDSALHEFTHVITSDHGVIRYNWARAAEQA